MSNAEPGTRFVVSRLRWWQDLRAVYRRSHGSVRVSSFATFDEADAERARLEAAVRVRVNPFMCGTAIHYWTHLGEPQLRDWLLDHGIDPPEPQPEGSADWAGWWGREQERLGADARGVVWRR